MAWIYLAESGDSQSHSVSGLGQLRIASETHMPLQSCLNECEVKKSQLLQYAQIFENFGAKSCQDLIFCTADFHVKTSAVLTQMQSAWAASEVDYLATSQGLSKKQTRDLYFSKTSQQLELVASTVSRKHLPSSGMIVGGRLYQPPKLAPHTYAKDGSYLPTPCAKEGGYNKGGGSGRVGKIRPTLSMMATKNLWPTVSARDWKGNPGKNREHYSLPREIGEGSHGKLNPTWVDWFMGYRLEWSALSVSAIQLFLSKRKRRLSA